MRRGGGSTPSATSTTCARCSTWSRSTPSRGSCATGCTPTGIAGRCSGASAARPFVRREPRYNRELHEEIRRLALERYGAGRRDVSSVQPPRTLTAPAREQLRGARRARRIRERAARGRRSSRDEMGERHAPRRARGGAHGERRSARHEEEGRADSLGSSRGAQERAARRGAGRHGRASEGAGAGTAPVDAQPGRVRPSDANRAGARERGLRSRGQAPCPYRGDRDRREHPPPLAPGSPRGTGSCTCSWKWRASPRSRKRSGRLGGGGSRSCPGASARRSRRRPPATAG